MTPLLFRTPTPPLLKATTLDPVLSLNELSTILEGNETETLLFSGWKVGGSNNFALDFTRFHKAAMANTSVVAIDFRLGDDLTLAAFPILNTLYQCLCNAKDLTLRNFYDDDGLEYCLRSTEKFEHIALHMRKTYRSQVNENDFLERFKNHRQLLTLELQGKDLSHLGQIVSLPATLKSLVLDKSNVDPRGLPIGVQHPKLSSLEKLKIDTVRLEGKEQIAFMEGMVRSASSLKDLDLTFDLSLDDGVWGAISGHPSVSTLKMQEEDNGSHAFGQVAIGDILTSCPALTFVDLRRDAFICFDFAQTIGRGSLAHLKELRLDKCHFTDSDMRLLLDGLTGNPSSVELLHIVYEQSGVYENENTKDATAASLCAFVRGAPRLHTLELDVSGDSSFWSCGITKARAEQCVDSLFQNVVISRIKVSLPKKCRKKLRMLVRLNKKGRQYLKEGNTKFACADFLGRLKIAKLDDVYTHFRENPILCDDFVPPATPTRTKRKRRRTSNPDKEEEAKAGGIVLHDDGSVVFL